MQRGGWIRPGAALAGLVFALVVPAGANAEDRYAAPSGSGPEPCVRAAPCSLTSALTGTGAGTGDRVLVRAGTYVPAASIVVTHALTVEPSPAPTRPLFQLAPGIVFSVSNAGAVVRGIDIVGAAVPAGSELVDLNGGTLERVALSATGGDHRAALVRNGGTIRDSVISAVGPDARGVVTGGSGGLLRNLTVSASAAAIHVDDAAGADQASTIVNTIAMGAPDVAASEGGGSVNAVLDHSNYQQLSTTGGANVEESATVSAPALLAAPAAGNFHQLPGSPTVNAGTSQGEPPPGGRDLDRAHRLQGPAPDIGAYEFDQIGPDTAISERPRRTVRTEKKKATVAIEFVSSEPGSAFLCSLDGGPIAACTSPYIARVGKGKHALFVFSFDALGNRDSSPAVAKWKVKRKKKKSQK